MTPYKNLGGDSNIRAYRLGDGAIDVQFRDYSVYTYTNASAGAHNIAQMHALATSGSGLNSFINRCVKTRYASKRTGSPFLRY